MTDPETVRAAIAEVRREARKAALIEAVVDAALALLAVDLALTVLGVTVPVPDAVPVGGRVVASVLVGLLVGGASGLLRARRYTLATFEAVNENLGLSLRTARDAVERDRDDPMARRLYEDLLDRLAAASSHELIDDRWLAARSVVVAVLVLAAVHAAVAGVQVDPLPDRTDRALSDAAGGGSSGDAADPDPTSGSDEFADNESVLGSPKTPAGGEDPLSANVSASYRGGEGEAAEYESQGLPDESGGVSAQRAGYDEPEAVEDADLIRDYAISLNESDSDG